MKISHLICSLVGLQAFALQAQTKLIAHRSHSGSNSSFNEMLRNDDDKPDNLGVAPTRMVTKAKLDSVIFVKENVAVMVTSLVREERDWGEPEYNNTKCINPGIWKPGHDTVYDHPLFSKQHSLDSIKKVLKEQYNFRNDIDKVKFVGYNNKKPKEEEKKQPIVDETPILVAQQIEPAQNTTTVTASSDDSKNSSKKKKKKWLWIGSIVVAVSLAITYTIHRVRKNNRFTP